MKCAKCNSDFKNIWNLKRHVMSKHPTQVSELVPQIYKNKTNYLHSCDICGNNFNRLWHLKDHVKSHVNIDPPTQKKKRNLTSHKCPLCDYCHTEKKKLMIHFQEFHNIEIVSQSRDFSSKNIFNEWKNQLELESKCKFRRHCSATDPAGNYTQFVCHRSGQFISKGKGMRHLKTRGSNKINAFCPASLKLFENRQGMCKVEYILKHVGHTNELDYIYLTPEERQHLASKIASKVPFDVILDEIRTSACDNDIKRMHLVTRKDLHNIKSSLNLTSAYEYERLANDTISIQAWVNEMRKTTDCVLYYKAQDVLDEEHVELKSEDFILIIMNEVQSEILRNYGTDCICIDSNYGQITVKYNYKLITLMVLDNESQGFPCAFLICSRADEEILKIFFKCILERTGCLKSNVFMSDVADSFYNAWLNVMGKTQYRLYCTWHIDEAWQKNLKKIQSKEKQALVYKQLRTILKERDEIAFNKILEEFHQLLLQDTETLEFANYLKNDFMSRCQNWAYCYRLYAGIKTDMHIENIHRSLKRIYLKGKTTKQLDKTVVALIKFVRGIFDRSTSMNTGEFTSKIQDIRCRHEMSLQLDKDLIKQTENGWEMPSSSKNFFETYYSIEENNEFSNCHCQLVCNHCGVCIHRYICSCTESSIRWNMCEHIHLLCRSKAETDSEAELLHDTIQDTDEMDDQLPDYLDNTICEVEAVPQEISSSNRAIETMFKKKKEEVKKKLDYMMDILDNIETPLELDEFDKCVSPFVPAWETVKLNEQKLSATTSNITRIPDKRNGEKQQKLFSTKKNKKSNEKPIKIPAQIESQNTVISVSNLDSIPCINLQYEYI